MSMTKQEVFDKVATHLLKQGEQSLSPGTESCVYRGENGTSCAVGCLIKDEHYSSVLEGHGVAFDAVEAALRASGVVIEGGAVPIRLLTYLQEIHDNCLPESWPSNLRSLAVESGLDLSVVLG